MHAECSNIIQNEYKISKLWYKNIHLLIIAKKWWIYTKHNSNIINRMDYKNCLCIDDKVSRHIYLYYTY